MMKLLVSFLFSFLLLQSTAYAEEKPKLILMPVQGEGLSESDKFNYQTSLQKGMSGKYTVFSGAEVKKRLQKYSAKTCDATECLQEVAIDFQGELVGRLVVTAQEGGFFLAIEVKNIFTDEIVETDNILCEGCNNFAVMRKLQGLSAPPVEVAKIGKMLISTAPLVTGAKIFVDDTLKGRVPSEITMSPGEHTIRIESETHTGEQEVVAKQGANEPLNIAVSLIQEPEGEVTVRTIPMLPNAEVYVDGEFKGKVNETLVLSEGKHTIKVETDNYVGERDIDVVEGQRKPVFLALTAADKKVFKPVTGLSEAAAEEEDEGTSWYTYLLGLAAIAALVPAEEDPAPAAPTTGSVSVSW